MTCPAAVPATRLATYVATVVALLVAACATPPAVTVDVVRGVPARTLRVRVAEGARSTDDQHIELIAIASANARQPVTPPRILWIAAHVEGQPFLHPPVTIPYGAPIPGYATSGPPVLPVGDYRVEATVSGVVARSAFRISRQNRVE